MRILNKLLAVLLLVGLLGTTLTLVGCDIGNPYAHINKMLAVKAKTLTLQITAGEGEDTLCSTYTVTNLETESAISYSYEELAPFEEVDGSFVIPDKRKVTKKGSMVVAGGKVQKLDGELCDLPLQSITLSRLQLHEEALSNAVLTDTSLSADVKDVQGLLGLSDTLTQVRLSITFTEEQLSSLDLTYVNESGTPITMAYTFTY